MKPVVIDPGDMLEWSAARNSPTIFSSWTWTVDLVISATVYRTGTSGARDVIKLTALSVSSNVALELRSIFVPVGPRRDASLWLETTGSTVHKAPTREEK